MSLTRRNFLRRSIGTALVSVAAPVATSCGAAKSVNEVGAVLVNHVGFPLGRAKHCLRAGTKPVPFVVTEVATGRVVYRGNMRPAPADLGQYVVGDFTELRRAGPFEVRCEGARSGPFVVGQNVYDAAIGKCVSYFAKQRCGDSKT